MRQGEAGAGAGAGRVPVRPVGAEGGAQPVRGEEDEHGRGGEFEGAGGGCEQRGERRAADQREQGVQAVGGGHAQGGGQAPGQRDAGGEGDDQDGDRADRHGDAVAGEQPGEQGVGHGGSGSAGGRQGWWRGA